MTTLPLSPIPDAISNNPKQAPVRDCVGARNRSNYLLYVATSEQKRFRNRYRDLTQNILVVVDSINFTYVLAGWEGLAYSSRVINNARSWGFGPAEAQSGRYYLANTRYANKETLLSWYRGICLREQYTARCTPQNKELLTYVIQVSGTS